jgi:diguanylate cyclase (GGDEF)-like protein
MKPKSSSLEILHTAAAHKNLQVILLSLLTLFTITVTGTINYLNGYPPYDLLMALGGILYTFFAYLFFYRRGRTEVSTVLILLFYAFVFTPTIWLFFDGLTTHTTYIILLMSTVIILYTNGRTTAVILLLYGLSTVGYCVYDLFFSTLPRHQTLVELITFSIAAVLLIIIIYQVKKVDTRTSSHLNHLSVTDELTGTCNHRSITTTLTRFERTGESDYAIVIFDIDDFKHINDTLGHLTGDKVLQQVCECTRRELHPEDDILGRFGGDEFIIIMRHCSTESALIKAEKIRKAISSGNLNITVSMGVCARSAARSDITALAQADAALYRAKQQGKDRVAR